MNLSSYNSICITNVIVFYINDDGWQDRMLSTKFPDLIGNRTFLTTFFLQKVINNALCCAYEVKVS